MPSRPKIRRFAVTDLTIHVAGSQRTKVEGHVTTQYGVARPILTVRIGDLIVYCHDAESVDSFAMAWIKAGGYAPQVGLPDRVRALSNSRNTAAIVLRVSGDAVHQVNALPAGASPTGADVVRVRVGNLTVLAHDRAAVAAWNRAWHEATILAETFWPRPDAFDEAEAEAQTKVARHGRKAPKAARQRN